MVHPLQWPIPSNDIPKITRHLKFASCKLSRRCHVPKFSEQYPCRFISEYVKVCSVKENNAVGKNTTPKSSSSGVMKIGCSKKFRRSLTKHTACYFT